MTRRTFGEEMAGELVGKAVIWGPAIAGGLLLGPVGIAVGVATTVAIVCSGSSGDGSATHASGATETGSST
jgi:hypothetical protein